MRRQPTTGECAGNETDKMCAYLAATGESSVSFLTGWAGRTRGTPSGCAGKKTAEMDGNLVATRHAPVAFLRGCVERRKATPLGRSICGETNQ